MSFVNYTDNPVRPFLPQFLNRLCSIQPMLPPWFVGTFVRITPNHVSLADLAAFRVIYAHEPEA